MTRPDPKTEISSPLPGLPATATAESGVGRFRWVICALLFFGVTKNYMDRNILAVLKTTLQHDLGWNEIDYSNLIVAFQGAYALGMLLTGRFIDRIGTRIGYAIVMVVWSIASMGHALCTSLFSFIMARSLLGFSESGVFPASIKGVSEWFPKKERAFTTGVFNSGTSIGAILAPLFVPWIVIHLGWRWSFLITGALGFVWLVPWLMFYQKPEEHKRCSASELEFIQKDSPQETGSVKWTKLIGERQTWIFAIGKFLTDPIWWFYLFWIPDFLQRQHGLHLTQIGLPILVIYAISDAGSVAGGWISSALIKRGTSVNIGRKAAMLLCALCVVPIAFAYQVSGLWSAVILVGIAAAGHQGFSANLFTLSSDMFPSRAVGSVVGIGGMAGAIGGMLIAKIVGYVLQWTGSYKLPFLMAASAYLIALAIIQILSPRLSPSTLGTE